MGMDEQYEQMQYFLNALTAFNDRLRSSMADLERYHEAVSPYWQDAMRRRYDAEWQPLERIMKHYMRVEGPSYVEFLNIKLVALERYLNGG